VCNSVCRLSSSQLQVQYELVAGKSSRTESVASSTLQKNKYVRTVSEEVKGSTRTRVDCTPDETELLRHLEDVLRRKLGFEKLTVKNLRSACRERNNQHVGKKLKIVKRLDLFFSIK
jgi:hypothetical protein